MTKRDSLGGENDGRGAIGTGSSPVPSMSSRSELRSELSRLDKAIATLDFRSRWHGTAFGAHTVKNEIEQRRKLDQQRKETRLPP